MTQPGTTHCMQAAHPMFAGHFPSDPLLPGAYLLALVIDDARDWLASHAPGWRASGVRAAKFTQPIRPGQPFRCAFGAPAGGALRFTVLGPADRIHATGTLELVRTGADEATAPDPGGSDDATDSPTDRRDA